MIKTYKKAGFKVNVTGKEATYDEALKMEKNGWFLMSPNDLFRLYDDGFGYNDYFWLSRKKRLNKSVRPVGLGSDVNHNIVYADNLIIIDDNGRARAVVLIKKIKEVRSE
jgi:hypothetical protein